MRGLDIVACALVSSQEEAVRRLPSVVWLEQTLTGTFLLHVLESGSPIHATLDAGDFDRDGDVDIVVGNFSLDNPVASPLSVFENLRVPR